MGRTLPASSPATVPKSLGVRAGIAPSAHILSLKVLDDRGRGVISDVIAALEWVVTNKTAYNVRVVNLSVGAAVAESLNTDPLTLAQSAPSTPASSLSCGRQPQEER